MVLQRPDNVTGWRPVRLAKKKGERNLEGKERKNVGEKERKEGRKKADTKKEE